MPIKCMLSAETAKPTAFKVLNINAKINTCRVGLKDGPMMGRSDRPYLYRTNGRKRTLCKIMQMHVQNQSVTSVLCQSQNAFTGKFDISSCFEIISVA